MCNPGRVCRRVGSGRNAGKHQLLHTLEQVTGATSSTIMPVVA
jgi:hypothetical protein